MPVLLNSEIKDLENRILSGQKRLIVGSLVGEVALQRSLALHGKFEERHVVRLDVDRVDPMAGRQRPLGRPRALDPEAALQEVQARRASGLDRRCRLDLIRPRCLSGVRRRFVPSHRIRPRCHR